MRKDLQPRLRLLSAAVLFTAFAHAQTTVITPCNMSTKGWIAQQSGGSTVSFENGPGTPPLGSGSVQFTVDASGATDAQMRTTNHNGMLLADISTLSYCTYVVQNNSAQATYIILNIDWNNDGSTEDLLFFEPVYQSGTYPSSSPIPNQCGANPNCVATNAWQCWDAKNGGWWAFSIAPGGPPLTTLADYIAAHPGARLATTPAGALRLVNGFGGPSDWGNFDGNADALTVNNTTYDFEPCDADNDGILDNVDNCPTTPNPGQEDADSDGVGNACDNCPNVQNPGQADMNNDGAGDVCDDSDNDGVVDAYDCDPLDNKKDKVLVCHKGQTICVAKNAVDAHLKHGDAVGPCATSPSVRTINPIQTNPLAPDKFSLVSYPNPSRDINRVQYSIPIDSRVNIKLYDLMGREIATLFNGTRSAGSYQIEFKTAQLTTGVYYYRMIADADGQQFVHTQKFLKVE